MSIMITEELKNLMQKYFDDFSDKRNNSELQRFIVDNSFPIVWFGDLEQYKNSKIKIITVGLNPSWHEFLKDKSGTREIRFPKMSNFKEDLAMENIEQISQSLCSYFDNNPYKPYFSSFENALINLLGASYGGKIVGLPADNIAIHADIFSAIATKDLWSDLGHAQSEFKRIDLFKNSLDYLSPKVIMVSIGKAYCDAWKALGVNPYTDDDLLKGKYHGEIEAYRYNGRIVIYGRNRQRPFAVSDIILEKASDKIIQEVYGASR